MKLQSIAFLLWGAGTFMLWVKLWMCHRADPIVKKLLWSAVLLLPLVGWVLYGGLYTPPGQGPTNSGNGDSGWDVGGAGH